MRLPDGDALSAEHCHLALGVPRSVPGTIYALAITGGITVSPVEGRTILFGRNRPEVHVCVGENDQRVSRRPGVLTRCGGRWEVSNTGKLPLRFPGSRLLFNGDEPMPLAPGYTPLFVRGAGGREHPLERYVHGEAASVRRQSRITATQSRFKETPG